MLYTEADLNKRVDEFSEMVRNTQEYKDYIHMIDVLKRKPELYDQVISFRRENYIKTAYYLLCFSMNSLLYLQPSSSAFSPELSFASSSPIWASRYAK